MQHNRPLLTLILIFLVSISYGQSFTYPLIKTKGQNITDFVPAGWIILDSTHGDLNKDAVEDAAIILQYKDSVSLVNSLGDAVLTQPRILLILFNNPADKNFNLVEQSNSFILKHDNPSMDDTYQELSINKGTLELKFHIFYNVGSWYVTNLAYKFRYHQEQFVLIGADKSSFHRATHDFEDYSYNFLTIKRTFTKGNDVKSIKKKTWKKITIPTLKNLKTFTEPFTWEVEKDIYL